MTAGKTFIKRRGTTAVPNATVHDSRISYAALGMLTVLLGRPDGAPSGYRALEGRGLGQKATLSALKELNEAGYRHLIKRRSKSGRIITDTVISETPTSVEAAQELIAEVTRNEDIHNVTHSPDHAAPSDARHDQPKQGKTAGQTKRRSSEARSSEARSSAAQVLRTSKGSLTTLRTQGNPTRTHAHAHARPEPCDHGETRGPTACAFCRNQTSPKF